MDFTLCGQLKEVEKLASKKGVGASGGFVHPDIFTVHMASNSKWLTWIDVVEKTVKDILQSMVSEGIVQSDKIGTSNCMSCVKVKANIRS